MQTDRAFGHDNIAKRAPDFIFVRCADKKTATMVKAKNPPEVIFFDPDGEELHRTGIRDEVSIEAAMDNALKKYANREISWTVYGEKTIAGLKESRKLAVLAFENDSKESEATLKALEDRTLVKLQDKCVFIRVSFRKDSEEAKLWNVASAPTILIVDPTKEAGVRSVIDRTGGKRGAAFLKGLIQKGLKAIEKDSSGNK